ncbi:MAG TPA: HD domain-containing phosphohydrolase [Niallia sp.]|nr:HD domain-containing phosphohydrolase [Niallia sp.]
MNTEPIDTDFLNFRLKEDVYSNTTEGLLLLKQGTLLTKKHIETLTKHKINPFTVIDTTTRISPEEETSLTSNISLLEEVKKVFQLILDHDDSQVDALLHSYEKIIVSSLNDHSIMNLINKKIEKNDYIYQHSINVGIISALIGKLLGMSRKQCHLLSQMGLFHDIGMLMIDPKILQKNTRLTHTEYKEIQKHTTYGKSLLFSISQLDILVSRAALLHHAKINGKGYPSNRTEQDIPFMIQVISVADAFHSMSSSYSYKKEKSFFEALNELMNEARTHALHPAIVVPFINYMMRQQLFKKVQLSNNEIAEIIFIHPNEPNLPLIRIGDSYIDLRKETSLKIVALAE